MSGAKFGALSTEELDDLYERITQGAADGREQDVQKSLQPLLRAYRHQENAAL